MTLKICSFSIMKRVNKNASGVDMKTRISTRMFVSKLLYVQVVIIGIDFSGCKVNEKENATM